MNREQTVGLRGRQRIQYRCGEIVEMIERKAMLDYLPSAESIRGLRINGCGNGLEVLRRC